MRAPPNGYAQLRQLLAGDTGLRLAALWPSRTYGVGTLGGAGFSALANNRRLEMQARLNFWR